MMYLIDGHNLIGKLPNVSLGEQDDERKLLRMLEDFHVQRSNEPILVVFDPARDGRGGWSDMRGRSAGVTVRFAPRNQTADDVIARLVQNAKSPRGIIVVSSDNAVKRAVRRHGAKTLQSEEFAVLLQQSLRPSRPMPQPPPAAKPEKPQETDVTYWMQFFKEPPPAPPKPPPATRRRRAAADMSAGSGRPSVPDEKPDASGDLSEWLRLFGEPREAADPKHLPPPDAPRRAPSARTNRNPEPDAEVDSVEYWLREMSKRRDEQ